MIQIPSLKFFFPKDNLFYYNVLCFSKNNMVRMSTYLHVHTCTFVCVCVCIWTCPPIRFSLNSSLRYFPILGLSTPASMSQQNYCSYITLVEVFTVSSQVSTFLIRCHVLKCTLFSSCQVILFHSFFPTYHKMDLHVDDMCEDVISMFDACDRYQTLEFQIQGQLQ